MSDIQDLVSLTELDYQQTNSFIAGVVGSGLTMRGWGLTLWSALVALGIQQNVWSLPLLGALVLSAFLVLDAHHSALYSKALRRSAELEDLLSSYRDVLGREKGNESYRQKLQVGLETNRFGVYKNLGQARTIDMSGLRPTIVFFGMYPVLFAVAVGIALGMALH